MFEEHWWIKQLIIVREKKLLLTDQTPADSAAKLTWLLDFWPVLYDSGLIVCSSADSL